MDPFLVFLLEDGATSENATKRNKSTLGLIKVMVVEEEVVLLLLVFTRIADYVFSVIEAFFVGKRGNDFASVSCTVSNQSSASSSTSISFNYRLSEHFDIGKVKTCSTI